MAAPNPAELVQAIMDKLELTQTELARALLRAGVDGVDYQRVHRWLKGTSPIRYNELWGLLELAGWLKADSGPREPLTAAEERRRAKLLDEAEQALARLREELG